MFSIYISASALADIYLQESDKPFKEQSDWFKILRKQTEIFTYGYVPVDNDFEDGFSVSDILENLGRSYDILITPADDYISQVDRRYRRSAWTWSCWRRYRQHAWPRSRRP